MTFRRSREKEGFWRSKIIYSLAHPDSGASIGELVLLGRDATFTSASRRDDFRVRKNFWGTRWMYTGDSGQPFGRYRWSFLKPSFEFADGSRYSIDINRKWRFSSEPAISGNLRAQFESGGTAVLELKNTLPMSFFSSEEYSPLEGSITTSITDLQRIAGLLLFFQTILEVRNRSSS